MASIDELKWQTMTAAINKIKGPQRFLRDLLFGRRETLDTETIEMSFLTGARDAAPFVKKNGEALLVEGLGEEFAVVEAPNIRIKRPFTPSALLYNRQPGTTIFASSGTKRRAIQQKVARELQRLKDLITNREEWMISQAIRGSISYTAKDEDHWQITYPRADGNTTTADTDWDEASSAKPEVDFLAAKRLISDGVGLAPTHVLLGEDAAEYFLQIDQVKDLLDNRRIEAGKVVYTSQFSEQGALYLGQFCGIEVWEYSRTINTDGTATNLVRDSYAEFVTASPSAENVIYYGAIPDMDALQGRTIQTEIFSKSWVEKDPSVMFALAHSRPLPVPRLPDSMVSMNIKVT